MIGPTNRPTGTKNSKHHTAVNREAKNLGFMEKSLRIKITGRNQDKVASSTVFSAPFELPYLDLN